jgi:hypothetical protein
MRRKDVDISKRSKTWKATQGYLYRDQPGKREDPNSDILSSYHQTYDEGEDPDEGLARECLGLDDSEE